MEHSALHLAIMTVLAAAVLLMVGVLTEAEPTAAVNPVPCPTPVPVATATPDGGPTYTPTLTHTPCLIKPAVTPTPPPSVGGVSALAAVSAQPASASYQIEGASDAGNGVRWLAAVVVVAALGGAAWLVRRLRS